MLQVTLEHQCRDIDFDDILGAGVVIYFCKSFCIIFNSIVCQFDIRYIRCIGIAGFWKWILNCGWNSQITREFFMTGGEVGDWSKWQRREVWHIFCVQVFYVYTCLRRLWDTADHRQSQASQRWSNQRTAHLTLARRSHSLILIIGRWGRLERAEPWYQVS